MPDADGLRQAGLRSVPPASRWRRAQIRQQDTGGTFERRRAKVRLA